jgi:hypothetical protein
MATRSFRSNDYPTARKRLISITTISSQMG